ncbi:MAG: hypothetical protein WD572_01790, partial [Gammaproteobacteria bacterium]
LRERIDQRRGDASEADQHVLDRQLKTAEPLTEQEQAFVVSLDTTAEPLTPAELAGRLGLTVIV